MSLLMFLFSFGVPYNACKLVCVFNCSTDLWNKAFLQSTFNVIICLQVFKDPVSNERGINFKKNIF